jgi:acyl carrier protein
MSGEREETTAAATVSDASYAQARLHFLHTMVGQSAAYNIARAVDLEGNLDVGALAGAVTECATRHEILRACFRVMNGRLRQIINPEAPALAVVDLRSVSGGSGSLAADRLADDLARREAMQPFNLARGPLLRVTVLLVTERRSLLLISVHHIIADGWSVGVLLRELSAAYSDFSNGIQRRSPFPELQYVDYAAWQRQRVEGGAFDADADFWRAQLREFTALALPTDRPRPSAPDYEGRTYRFTLDAALMARLRALARQEGASYFMVLLAGFVVLLHRFTGQADIAVGGTTSGRTRPELTEMIGMFVNMLVLRVRVDESMTIRQVVRATAEVCLDAYQHQELPFERIAAESAHLPEPGKHSLFQVVFQMLEEEDAELPMAGLRARVREVDGDTSGGFDLIWNVGAADDRTTVLLEYATALFDHDTITEMADHWVQVLKQMAEDPDRGVSAGGKFTATRSVSGAKPPPGKGATPDATARQLATRPATDAAVPPELARLWTNALGVPDAVPDVSFFDAGGNSLLAAVLITQIEEELGVRISLDEFFRQPTLSALTEWIRRDRPPAHV